MFGYGCYQVRAYCVVRFIDEGLQSASVLCFGGFPQSWLTSENTWDPM